MISSPTEIRDESFAALRPEVLTGCRRTVFEALLAGEPCTTRELADRIGMSLLTVRPRVTELLQSGLVVLAGKRGHQGVYRGVRESEVERSRCGQLELS